MSTRELKFVASKSAGEVSALFQRPDDARALFVFAHGAGAGMGHAFMEALTERLAGQAIATLRYQFPYMEQGSRRPSPQLILLATVRSAVECARELAPELPLIAGGKSMGGRMTSLAAAAEPLTDVRGIAFVGFPLHPSGKPGITRAEHLSDVSVPMLFLQGTRDKLCDLELFEPVRKKLGASAALHVVEGADHGFHVLKRSGRDDDQVLDELAQAISDFAAKLA